MCCQLCLGLWILGIVATGSSPTDPSDLDFCLAKAKGSQAACHCRMQGGETTSLNSEYRQAMAGNRAACFLNFSEPHF